MPDAPTSIRHRHDRRMMLTMGGALLVTSCSKGDDLQSGRFRDEVAAAARTEFPDWSIALDPADPTTFRVDAFQIYVGNLYAVVDGLEPGRRRAEIVKFLGVVEAQRRKKAATESTSGETFDQARPRLRIQIVPTDYLAKGLDVVHRKLSDELVIVYALDEPDSYGTLTNKQIDRWGVAAATVENTAIANLEDASRTVEPKIRTGRGGGFVTISTGDSYDGARLLLPGFLDRVRKDLGPSLVMMVPRRDFLIGWTADYSGRLDLYADAKSEFERGPYSRSRELFLASAEGVRPLRPEERSVYD
ncbi:DUF1444 family protein [Methylobacterium brachythecii]|nr:DUF1444 family protein [Methylobacterium brachythecii]